MLLDQPTNVSLNDLEKIVRPLRKAERVAIMSGAGLSAESGIPTFRDAGNGLWADVDPMAVASIDGFYRDPAKVWAWHNDLRSRLAGATPNAGHRCIAELEALLAPAEVLVITQNIDGFHQEAGSHSVLELHGTVKRIRCHRQCGFAAPWEDVVPERCPACGALVRPDIVWFGEALDSEILERAADAALAADVFFVIGTSGVVQPAAGLAVLAKDAGALVVEVNPGETNLTEFADYSARTSASEFLVALCRALRSAG